MIKTLRSVLTEDEHILYDARIHWIIFGNPIFYGLLGILVWIFFHPLVGGIILFMNLYPAYYAIVGYITTHLVLTNRKVIGRTGFLTRDWRQMSFNQIETAYLEEPIIGRILGYSTVVIQGTGAGAISFRYIIDGDRFIKKMETMMGQKNAEK